MPCVDQGSHFRPNRGNSAVKGMKARADIRGVTGKERSSTMHKAALLSVAVAALALAACSSKQDSGALVGAIAGGAIGNQFGGGDGKVIATAIGAVIGGIAGSEIGALLDENDRKAASQAEVTALEGGQSGVATPWRNPDSGHYGVVVPGQPYKKAKNDCRDFTHTIYMDGQPQTMRGTACRNPDGTWRNVG
jgi:surface antigen